MANNRGIVIGYSGVVDAVDLLRIQPVGNDEISISVHMGLENGSETLLLERKVHIATLAEIGELISIIIREHFTDEMVSYEESRYDR